MTNPLDRMAAGYSEPSLGSPLEQKLARKQAETARLHVEDPAYERLLKWKQDDDPRYAALDAHTRTALGYYERGKAAANKELDR